MARSRPGSLRIIGGDWRGRRLSIPAMPGLRPTPERVRETLFNWLAPEIRGCRCLDAFAGTGALGLEALSRGAARATLIERDRRLVASIYRALDVLQADDAAQVLCGESPAAWSTLRGPFDIVFLDPPFESHVLTPALAALPPLLADQHRVYIEFDAASPPEMPEGWSVARDKTAGEVGYRLLAWAPAGATRAP